MGNIIRRTASADDIIADARKTMENAKIKGGKIFEIADNRLSTVLLQINTIDPQIKQLANEESTLSLAVISADNEADNLVGKIRDELFNLLGRPSSNPVMDTIFPGGIKTYTKVPVAEQPLHLEILKERIRAATHNLLTEEIKTKWIGDIDTAGRKLKTALDAYLPKEAMLNILEQSYRTLARTAQMALSRIKRDLLNEDMNEAQIFEIIPDRK